MGFWKDLGERLIHGGMDEKTYKFYERMSTSELVREAKYRHNPKALMMLKIRIRDNEIIQDMIRKG